MIALAVLLLAASPAAEAAQGAIAAERDFAQMAQTQGQWTAFRHFAADDALLFTPGPTDAREALADLPDPPVAVMWWPARSFVSCDGTVVVNTGPWVRPGNRRGYFVTVWQHQADGNWRWLLDDGSDLETPIAAGEAPVVRQAACQGELPRRRTAEVAQAGPRTAGQSDDATLRWSWADRGAQGMRLSIQLFDGEAMETVFTHDTPAQIP